jgi:hypothetical protein
MAIGEREVNKSNFIELLRMKWSEIPQSELSHYDRVVVKHIGFCGAYLGPFENDPDVHIVRGLGIGVFLHELKKKEDVEKALGMQIEETSIK